MILGCREPMRGTWAPMTSATAAVVNVEQGLAVVEGSVVGGGGGGGGDTADSKPAVAAKELYDQTHRAMQAIRIRPGPLPHWEAQGLTASVRVRGPPAPAAPRLCYGDRQSHVELTLASCVPRGPLSCFCNLPPKSRLSCGDGSRRPPPTQHRPHDPEPPSDSSRRRVIFLEISYLFP